MKSIYPNLVKILNREKITVMDVAMECCCPHELSLTCSHESSSDCLTFCHQSLQGCRLTTGGNKDYVVIVPSISCSTTYLII